MSEPATKADPVLITEDEAALYDRQIRLWGLEAQQRMRNATILVLGLRGTATETVKNICLAGIGKLLIVDSAAVSGPDLGAGFFFREDDVGKKRAEAAKARIQALNPLVVVEAVSEDDALERLEGLVPTVDLVCATDMDRDTLIRVNTLCRASSKPFYAGGTFGMLGYIFCDLVRHEYISPDRSAAKDGVARTLKLTVEYPALADALGHVWTGMTKRQTKELNPTVPFTILALWEYQHLHHGALPTEIDQAPELATIANGLLRAADVHQQVLTGVSPQLIESMATSAAHEFMPVCAVLGGMLAQDILKALAAREAPLANFLTFDGNTGSATVVSMKM